MLDKKLQTAKFLFGRAVIGGSHLFEAAAEIKNKIGVDIFGLDDFGFPLLQLCVYEYFGGRNTTLWAIGLLAFRRDDDVLECYFDTMLEKFNIVFDKNKKLLDYFKKLDRISNDFFYTLYGKDSYKVFCLTRNGASSIEKIDGLSYAFNLRTEDKCGNKWLESGLLKGLIRIDYCLISGTRYIYCF